MNYILYCEIDDIGFIIDRYDNDVVAKICYDKIHALGQPPTPFSFDNLIAMFRELNLREYDAEKQSLIGKHGLIASSNGFFNVGIVEVKE